MTNDDAIRAFFQREAAKASYREPIEAEISHALQARALQARTLQVSEQTARARPMRSRTIRGYFTAVAAAAALFGLLAAIEVPRPLAERIGATWPKDAERSVDAFARAARDGIRGTPQRVPGQLF